MKRILSVVLALVLSLTMCVSIYADNTSPVTENAKLYIETSAIPNDVTAYATDIFTHLDKEILSAFCPFSSQNNQLTLSQGFKMVNVNTMDYLDIASYFLILSGDTVCGIMTVSEIDGKLGFQIDRNSLSCDISTKLSANKKPYKIYVSENAYYFVQDNKVIHISCDEYLKNNDCINDDCSIITNGLASRVTDDETVASNIVKPLASRSVADSANIYPVSDGCGTVFVDNVSYLYNDRKYHGTCWASSIASVCYYYFTGCRVADSHNDVISASSLRFEIINERSIENKGDLTTSMSDTVSYINGRLPMYGYGYLTYAYKPSKLSWNSVMSSLVNKHPSIMGWFYREFDTVYGHAMVLDGYNDSDLEQYRYLIIRDSNTQPYYFDNGFVTFPMSVVGYNNPYIIGVLPYQWEDTVCVAGY